MGSAGLFEALLLLGPWRQSLEVSLPHLGSLPSFLLFLSFPFLISSPLEDQSFGKKGAQMGRVYRHRVCTKKHSTMSPGRLTFHVMMRKVR
jgi:hypothetical protein